MTIHNKLERLTRLSNKRAVSVAAGLGRQYLYHALANEDDISAKSAAALAKTLGVDPGWLIDEARGWPPVRVEPVDDVKDVSARAA